MRKFLALCLAGSLALSAAACGSAQEPEKKEGGGGREKIVISCGLADDSQVVVRQKYMDEPLKKAFPDVDIEFKMYNDRQSLQVEVAGGGGPDILALDGPTDVAEFAKSDRVLAMDSYAQQYKWDELFYDWAYGSCFYNGKLYSLPTSFEGMVLYYNEDVFEEHKWQVPETLEELEALMAEIKEAGIIPLSFGNANYQGAVDWLYSTFTSCYGGPEAVKSALEGNSKFTDPAIRDSLQMMVDWWKAGYIGDNSSQAVTQEDMIAFFAEGRAAMMINGTWATSQLGTVYPDCNWDSVIMPPPQGKDPIFPLATGGGWSINANSPNPDLAAEVLNFLFTNYEDHYASIVEANYQPYPLKTFEMEKIKGVEEKVYEQYEMLMDAQTDNRIGYCSWTFYPSEMRVYMNENTDSVFLDALSLDEYLEKSQSYLDAAIEAGTVPILP